MEAVRILKRIDLHPAAPSASPSGPAKSKASRLQGLRHQTFRLVSRRGPRARQPGRGACERSPATPPRPHIDPPARVRASSPSTSTSTTAPARSAASISRATKPPAPSSASGSPLSRDGRHDPDPLQHRRNRPPLLRRHRPARLSSSSRTPSNTGPEPITPTQDVFDRIQADDLKQAATIMATFVYEAAMAEERVPRKNLER